MKKRKTKKKRKLSAEKFSLGPIDKAKAERWRKMEKEMRFFGIIK